MDALTVVGFRLQTELLDQPAFNEAKQAWHTLLPERYGLQLVEVNQTLQVNPGPQLSSGIIEETAPPPEPVLLDDLAWWAGQALQDVRAFARQTGWLQRLAGLVRQRWPRR